MAPSLPILCCSGSLEEVRAALAGGQEVNQRDADIGGNTGLIVAADCGREAVVELLLQQPGLDVNLTNEEFRWTALHMACVRGHAGIVRRLLAHPSLTCHNAGDINGYTPLMVAVKENRVECVMELVAVEGVDLETRDSEGVGLEEAASPEVWQVVREERRRRRGDANRNRTLMKSKGVLEKYSKQKKIILKKAKAEKAREKRMRAVEAQRATVESVQETFRKEAETVQKAKEALQLLETNSSKTKEKMMVEFEKLDALMEEDSAQDKREEVECPVCCEEMVPPRTIFQCSEGHPVCSSCRPKLVHCPTCRGDFMGRNRGMEQLVLAILDIEEE